MSRKNKLDPKIVACRFCHAPVGQVCDGVKAPEYHLARKHDAETFLELEAREPYNQPSSAVAA